jgi:hypothetical protein
MARIGPVDGADGIRARRPPILAAYAETREAVLVGGIVPAALKGLCARFIAEDADVVARYEAGGYAERERAALQWTLAVAWDDTVADDALWERLHEHFTDPELVELGYAIAFMLGQAHWLRTLGLAPEIPQAPS